MTKREKLESLLARLRTERPSVSEQYELYSPSKWSSDRETDAGIEHIEDALSRTSETTSK